MMSGKSGATQVAIGIIFHEGRLLISRRGENVHLAGLWEFPGGKCLPHESLKECLQRELLEELGVEVKVHQKIKRLQHRYPLGSVALHAFRCSIISGEPMPVGCQEIRWVLPTELGSFTFPLANGPLLQELQFRLFK